MDIKSYLLELIATQKVVGINALGTLYKKKTPGRYDSESHSFLPPKHEITFSSEITKDTTLADFISEERNISIESANYYIDEFVEGIQAQLADHQHADLSPLGTLKLVDEKIVFEVSNATDGNRDFYGLPTISATVEESQTVNQEPEFESNSTTLEEHEELAPESETTVEGPELSAIAENQPINYQAEIEAVSTEQNSQAEPNDQPIYNEIEDLNKIQEQNEQEERVDIETKSEEKEPLITDPLWKPTVIHRYEYDDEDEEDENSGGWIRKFLKALFTLIIIVAVIGALLYYFYPDLFYTIKGNFSNPPTESEPVLNIDPGTSSKIDTPVADSLKTAIVLAPPVKDSLITQPPNKTVVYEVIGSAMKTQKKADEVISILSKRGINAKKVDALPGRRIKISLGTFTDFSLAKKFQDSLKIKLRNPEIYIQTIKPKN